MGPDIELYQMLTVHLQCRVYRILQKNDREFTLQNLRTTSTSPDVLCQLQLLTFCVNSDVLCQFLTFCVSLGSAETWQQLHEASRNASPIFKFRQSEETAHRSGRPRSREPAPTWHPSAR